MMGGDGWGGGVVCEKLRKGVGDEARRGIL